MRFGSVKKYWHAQRGRERIGEDEAQHLLLKLKSYSLGTLARPAAEKFVSEKDSAFSKGLCALSIF